MKQTQPNRTITHRDQQHNNQRYYKVRNEHNYEQRYEEYEDRYDAYEERFHQRSYEFKQNHQILRQNNQVYSQNNYISSPTYTQSYIQIDEKEEASKKRKNSFTTPNTQKKARYNPYELY